MTEPAASQPPGLRAGRSRFPSDRRLTRRASKGDRRAIEAIYERYHQELYRFCLAMVGNPHDAQDALQNAMVKVLRALPGEERHIKLRPWLYRIARNEAIETLRRRRDSAELDPEHPAATVEIAQTAETRDRLRGLVADLSELPERQRAALVMRELGGAGFEEIAAAFETSPAVARQTVYEARLSLRQMEEGREMTCETVMRELSDADGRVTRRREVRAHLRNCARCRAFRDGIAERRGNLAAIAPLPLAASVGLLNGVFAAQAGAATAGIAAGAGGAAGAGAGSVAGAAGAGAGKVVATSAIVKSAATVAVVAAVGVTAADRGGLIDAPLPGGSDAARNVPAPGTPAPLGGAAGPARPSESQGSGDTSSRGDGGAKDSASTAGKAQRRNGDSGRRRARKEAKRRGNGKAHGKRRGRPDGLPAASAHGQQTAAAHKSPNANPAPASGPRSQGRSAAPPSSSAPKPSHSTKESSTQAPPPPPGSTEQAEPGPGDSAPKSAQGKSAGPGKP